MALSYTDEPRIGSAAFKIKLCRLVMGEALLQEPAPMKAQKVAWFPSLDLIYFPGVM